jgi:RNA polymerase sigma factor (sigma-70 family)
MLPELCAQLEPELRRILRSSRIPFEDAEDLLQTTLVFALRKWHEIREPKAWLLGTLGNRCTLYWRERRRQGLRYEPLDPWEPALAVAPAQERRAMLLDLEMLARRLPARQRAILFLRYRQGLRETELARATGLARSSVRKTLHRAVSRLRSAMASAAHPPQQSTKERAGCARRGNRAGAPLR